MLILKKFIFSLIILSFFAFFLPADLDPAYIKAFGYSAMCVSKNGVPDKTKYDPSQFEFRDGKFFVDAGGRIDLRVFLPKGKLYKDILDGFNKKHREYSKVDEDLLYWKIYASHDVVGNRLFEKWESSPAKQMDQSNQICYIKFDTNNSRDWDGSAVKWDDTENNDLQRDVGIWLRMAQSGWQLYIIHTVGFRRNCPENSYWDYNQGRTVTPIAFETAPPIAYAIVEVK
ncbi:MAG: hypothetical protein AB9882_10705 [Ignavibacteriaceae bacterium]